MRYILIDIHGIGQAFQEVSARGNVLRYTDMDGNTLFESVPTGLASEVLDDAPVQPSWALPDPDEPPYVAPPPPPRRLTKLGFVGRLGADFPVILEASKQSVGIEMFVRMLDWATPDADGTSVDLDDPRVVGALQQLEAAGILGEGRAQEILSA